MNKFTEISRRSYIVPSCYAFAILFSDYTGLTYSQLIEIKGFLDSAIDPTMEHNWQIDKTNLSSILTVDHDMKAYHSYKGSTYCNKLDLIEGYKQ